MKLAVLTWTSAQMAKRMKFSVVGLPHYTVWHLYEPSVDDIRRIEEMERERKKREAEENAKKDRMDKINNQFDTDTRQQHEKDKAALREEARAMRLDTRGPAS